MVGLDFSKFLSLQVWGGLLGVSDLELKSKGKGFKKQKDNYFRKNETQPSKLQQVSFLSVRLIKALC